MLVVDEIMTPITQAILDDLIAAGFVPGPKVGAIIDKIVENVMADTESLEKENSALCREVNQLRARLGEGRKYVEWTDKPRGGCPVSGG